MTLEQTQAPGLDKSLPLIFPHIFSNKAFYFKFFYVLNQPENSQFCTYTFVMPPFP